MLYIHDFHSFKYDYSLLLSKQDSELQNQDIWYFYNDSLLQNSVCKYNIHFIGKLVRANV